MTSSWITYSIFSLLFILPLVNRPGFAAGDNYPVGSRAAAISNTSVMYPDLWSVSHNQAGLGFYHHLAVGIHHENKFLVNQFNLHSVVFSLPTQTGTFGLNYSYFGYSEYNESKVGLGFGKALNKKFSAGLQFNYMNTYVAEETGNHGAMVIEGGILAKPFDHFLIGFHVFNPTGSRFSNLVDEERIPMIFRLGIGYEYRETLFIGFETEKDLELNPAFFKGGIEYWFIQHVCARTGVVVGDYVHHSFGLGFKMRNIQADVAFSHQQVLGYTPHLSIQYIFK